jgi:hypothetical protein
VAAAAVAGFSETLLYHTNTKYLLIIVYKYVYQEYTGNARGVSREKAA